MTTLTITTTITLLSGTTQEKRCHVLQPTRRAVQRQNTSLMLHVRSSSYCICHNIKIIAKRTAHKASHYVLILVTIIDGPSILEGPKTVRAREGENVSFNCKVTVCKNFILKGWSFNIWQLFFADLLCRRKATLSRNTDGLAWAPTCPLATLLYSALFPLR